VPRIAHPPAFTSTFIVKKKVRFQASAAGSADVVQIASIGDLWCVATTATSASQLAEFIRIKKIEMWGPMASDLVPVTVTCDWTGAATAGLFGKSNRVSDTSVGSTEPAHILSRPPQGSQIAEWLNAANSNTAFQLTFPSGTVVDFTYELVVRDSGSTQAVGTAVVGATVGANYLRALDNRSPGTGVLIPVAYSTI